RGGLWGDPSEAEEPEPGAGEVAAEEPRAGPVVLPAALPDPPICGDDIPPRRKDQRERQVGYRSVENSGRVRDGDTAPAARLDVDEVVADAVVRDEAEVGEKLELLGSNARDADGKDVDARLRLRRRPSVHHLDLELIPRGAGKRLCRRDPHTVSISALRRLAAVVTIVIPFAGEGGKTRLHESAEVRNALAAAMFE